MFFTIGAKWLRRRKLWQWRRNGTASPVELNNVPTLRGQVLTLLEPDYQYGVGPLRLRVERVDLAHPLPYEGEDWYPVEGVQVSADGTELGMRQVLVRGSRLRK
jgi:hypothetical protein